MQVVQNPGWPEVDKGYSKANLLCIQSARSSMQCELSPAEIRRRVVVS